METNVHEEIRWVINGNEEQDMTTFYADLLMEQQEQM